MNVTDVNTALCEVLGVDPKTTRAVNVKIRAGEYPIVTVRSIYREARPIEEWTNRFELVPLSTQPGEVETTTCSDRARSYALKKDMAA